MVIRNVLFLAFLLAYVTVGYSQNPCFNINNLKRITGSGVISSPVEKIDKLAVLFLNDECPICRHYTPDLEGLDSLCRSVGVTLIGVFSGRYSKKRIKEFAKKYGILIPLYHDKKTTFAASVAAQVTPEIFLIDCLNQRILYQGLIDDSYADLGVRKSTVKNHYFADALRMNHAGSDNFVARTRAIGCMIQHK